MSDTDKYFIEALVFLAMVNTWIASCDFKPWQRKVFALSWLLLAAFSLWMSRP